MSPHNLERDPTWGAKPLIGQNLGDIPVKTLAVFGKWVDRAEVSVSDGGRRLVYGPVGHMTPFRSWLWPCQKFWRLVLLVEGLGPRQSKESTSHRRRPHAAGDHEFNTKTTADAIAGASAQAMGQELQ